jgi:hypothetical protein
MIEAPTQKHPLRERNRLRFVIGFDQLALPGLEFKHFEEVGDHGTGAVEPVQIDFRDLFHNFEKINQNYWA